MTSHESTSALFGNRRTPLTVTSGSATFTIALTGLMLANLAPLVMTALGDLGHDLDGAGLILTIALLVSAVVGLTTSPLASRQHRRTLALIGLMIATVSFAVAAWAPDNAVATGAFIVGSAGTGAAISTSGAAIATFQDSNRASATNGVLNRVMVMALLALIPMLTTSQASVFGVMAAVTAIAAVLTVWLPNIQSPVDTQTVPDVPTSTAGSPIRRTAVMTAGLALLLLFPIWGSSEDAIWTLAPVLGEVAGAATEQTDFTLTAAAGGGAVAMLVVTIVGERMGRVIPLSIALLLGGAIKVGLSTAQTPELFMVLVIALNTIYGFAFVLFVATAAALDARGRWSGPLIGAYLVGSSFAPLIGTWMMESYGVATFCLTMAAVSIVAIIPTALIARVSQQVERVTNDEDRMRPDGFSGADQNAEDIR